jgi:hypothetical protein
MGGSLRVGLDASCHAKPDLALLAYDGDPNQILWAVDAWPVDAVRIVITPKPPSKQDFWRPTRGREIFYMLAPGYVITQSQDPPEALSGVPLRPPFTGKEKKRVYWKYNIAALKENGEIACTYDPQGCWQQGSGACDP